MHEKVHESSVSTKSWKSGQKSSVNLASGRCSASNPLLTHIVVGKMLARQKEKVSRVIYSTIVIYCTTSVWIITYHRPAGVKKLFGPAGMHAGEMPPSVT